MCIIVHRPAGAEIPRENLDECIRINKDGWGMMYLSGDRIVTTRSLDMSEFHSQYGQIPKGVPLGIHFRIKTHGLIDHANLHPYKILDYDEDGEDMYLMHNGTIDIAQTDKNMSDTWHLSLLLKKMLKGGNSEEILNSEDFTWLMSKLSSHSKFMILSSKTKMYHFFNQKGFVEDFGGCSFSNHSYKLYPAYNAAHSRSSQYFHHGSYNGMGFTGQHGGATSGNGANFPHGPRDTSATTGSSPSARSSEGNTVAGSDSNKAKESKKGDVEKGSPISGVNKTNKNPLSLNVVGRENEIANFNLAKDLLISVPTIFYEYVVRQYPEAALFVMLVIRQIVSGTSIFDMSHHTTTAIVPVLHTNTFHDLGFMSRDSIWMLIMSNPEDIATIMEEFVEARLWSNLGELNSDLFDPDDENKQPLLAADFFRPLEKEL